MKLPQNRLSAFLDGISRVLDVGVTRKRLTLNQSDREALASDWKAVGDDIRTAVSEYENGKN
jgi:hypothetical protein